VAWWGAFYSQEALKIKPWNDSESYCGQRPGEFTERPFAPVDLADPDVDGDTLLDGEDDQDNDDVNNIVELYETEKDLDGNGPGDVDGDGVADNPEWCGRGVGLVPSIDRGGEDWAVNAFNPCAPDPRSRSCPSRLPIG
jgi:hypothetical protein